MLNFCKSSSLPYAELEKELIYQATRPLKTEQREIEKSFARLFSSDDGKRVLAYLQATTFHRALNANTADEELRYAEGQRSLVATILRLIDRGRNP